MIRRLSHICIDLALAGMVALAVLAGFVAWRLADGPISLGFAKPYFDRALAGVSAPNRVWISDVSLTWGGWARPLEIRVIGASVAATTGKVLASIPEVSVSLAFAPLLAGKITPTRIGLFGPALTMIREVDGRLTIGLSGGDGSIVPINTKAIADPRSGSGLWTGLRRIGVERGRLRIEDRRRGLALTAPHATVSIIRNENGLEAMFDVQARLGQATAPISGTVRWNAADGSVDVAADFGTLMPSLFAMSLAGAIPEAAQFRGLAVPSGGTLRARIDTRGTLQAVRFTLTGGPGSVIHPAFGSHRFDVTGLSASGSYEAARDGVILDGLELDLGGLRISLNGSVSRLSSDAVASGSATLVGLSLEALPRYWPKSIAKGARAWVTRNLDRGGIENLKAEFTLKLPADDSVTELTRAKVTLGLTGARVHYFRPFDPIVGIDAAVEIDRERIGIAIKRGFLRELHVSDGTVTITGLSSGNSIISVETALQGPLKSALKVLDNPRFGYASRLSLEPSMVSGDSKMHISAKLPAIDALKFSDVEIAAAGRLESLSIPAAVLGWDLVDGSFSARVDASGMEISGAANFAGTAAEIDWSERFDDTGPFRRRYDVRARLGEADRARLGLDLAPFVGGLVDVAGSYQVSPEGIRSASGTIDLSAGTVAIGALDWRKQSGVKGTASFDVVFSGDRVRTVQLGSITAGELNAAGRVELSPDGGRIEAIDVVRFKLGDRIDIGGRIKRDDEAGWIVDVTGRRFDASPFVRRVWDSRVEVIPPIRVSAMLDRLVLRKDQHIDAARVSLWHDASAWRKIRVEGQHAEAKPVSINYTAETAIRRLTIDSTDAGRTFKIFGLFERIRGGRLTLSAEQPIRQPVEPWSGQMLVKRFVLAGVPDLARALGVAPFGTLSKRFDGDGIWFHRLELPFRYDGTQVRIKNGKALGRELGLTGRGTVDLEARKIDLRGTLIPAYTFNSALGSIPVVGLLFSPERGGGLFAATFNVIGSLDKPAFTFNPLAALAPGFLRGLLKGIGKVGDLPENDKTLLD